MEPLEKVSDILEVAVRIERHATSLYQRLARTAPSPRARDVFSYLAAQELVPPPLDGRARSFEHRPHVLALADRASDASIAAWLEAVTTPTCLASADRIDAPFPQGLSSVVPP